MAFEWPAPSPLSQVQLGPLSLWVLCPPLLSSSPPRDLAPRDLSGTSDPFARVFWGRQTLETSVSGEGQLGKSGAPGGAPSALSLSCPRPPSHLQIIKKTRFPHWDEVLELRETPGAPSPLRVELWDWDMVGKDDFLGMVSPGVRKGGCEGCLIRSG